MTETIFDVLRFIFATFIGACSGAYVALYLQREHEKRKDTQIDFMAGNRALFALCCQWNSIISLKQIIKPYASNPDRWHALPRIHRSEEGTPRINVDSLAPLLLRKDAQLLSELFIIQKNFDYLFSVLHERNHDRRLLTDLVLHGEPLSSVETELKVLTEFLYNQPDKIISSLRSGQDRLEKALCDVVPDTKPMHFEMHDEGK